MIVSGARVVTPGRDLGVADVRIENGVIAEVGAKVSPKEGSASSRRATTSSARSAFWAAARSPQDRSRTSFSSTIRSRRA